MKQITYHYILNVKTNSHLLLNLLDKNKSLTTSIICKCDNSYTDLINNIHIYMKIYKSSLLSSLETDHLGSCPTEYIPKIVNTHSVTMIKKRNSTNCKHDYQTISNLPLNKQQSTVANYLWTSNTPPDIEPEVVVITI
ncbi:hypothetical protein KSF78_0004150 [Schistosoma japonicum]|nr:hypothetical protein KSF78_0004150 [Schistosoma japonicum]